MNLERMQIFQMARRIGLKLAAGEPLAHEESRWLDLLRMDQGDGEPLCAPVSFSPENDFCARCPNFKRCALRLVETLQQNRGLSS